MIVIVSSDLGTATPCSHGDAGSHRYEKKTFLGIIVIVIVSCIVCTSLVWLLFIYRSGLTKREYKPAPPQPDSSEDTNVQPFQREEISYMPLKSSSSCSTQNGRESPRSTATYLTSSESQTASFPRSTSGSENASGSDKASSGGNMSSENSLKGSRSSLTSSYPSDSSLPFTRHRVKAQIHSSDSDSEKHCNSKKRAQASSSATTDKSRDHFDAPDIEKSTEQQNRPSLMGETSAEPAQSNFEDPLIGYSCSTHV